MRQAAPAEGFSAECDFLIECAPVFQDERLVDSGQRFLYASRQWDSLALDLWQLSLDPDTELLIKMSAAIADLYVNEKDIYFSACRSLRFHRQLCPGGFLLEQ